jgi:hypothetical protein
MTIGHLWYIKRAGAPKGPFPSSIIEKNIALGRILASDQISSDGTNWQSAAEFPDFDVLQKSGQQPVVKRRLDERQSERRTPAVDQTPDENQRLGRDRRSPEDPDVVAQRQRANRVWQSLRAGPGQLNKGPLLLAAGLLLSLIVAAVALAPAPRTTADCAAPPAPGVNWEFCNKAADNLRGAKLAGAVLRNAQLAGADLTGADLRNADLAYADLSGAVLREAKLDDARLVGVTLRGASLVDASLAGADLEFADLTAANVEGANATGVRLRQAIMPDGRVCNPAQAADCRLRP